MIVPEFGNGVTVTTVVVLQPVAVIVNVTVSIPGRVAISVPVVAPIIAIELLLHVPPVVLSV